GTHEGGGADDPQPSGGYRRLDADPSNQWLSGGAQWTLPVGKTESAGIWNILHHPHRGLHDCRKTGLRKGESPCGLTHSKFKRARISSIHSIPLFFGNVYESCCIENSRIID